MNNRDMILKKLIKIEKELEKCRTSAIQDGWQTSRYAKKARKWDVLAKEKMVLKQELDCCDDKTGDVMCTGCNCWKMTRHYCG